MAMFANLDWLGIVAYSQRRIPTTMLTPVFVIARTVASLHGVKSD